MVKIPTKDKKADSKEIPTYSNRIGKEAQAQIDFLVSLMTGVVLALLIGFAVMFVTVGILIWNAHLWTADVYRGFIKELDENNNKSEMFYKELKIYNELKTNSKTIEPKKEK